MLNSVLAPDEAVQATGLIHRVYPGSAETVFLLVHGRTGNASVMWTFSKAFEALKPLTIAPQAPHSDPLGGFSWWVMPNVPGSESARVKVSAQEHLAALQSLQSFIIAASDHYGFEPKQICAMGFSQGAALLSGLSLLEPQMFRHVALLAGFVPEFLFTDPELRARINANAAVPRPNYFIGHGRQDEMATIDRARAGAERLRSVGLSVSMVEEDVGHKVGSGALRALAEIYSALPSKAPVT